LSVFDANLILGRLGWRPVGVESATQMLATMDRFGIERGLVSHLTACIHDADTGNALLFEAIAGQEQRLLPVPVVDLNDGGHWQEQVPEWTERGVRALRLAPAFYRNSLAGDAATSLAAVAREHRWPIVVAIETVRGIPWVSGQPHHAVELAQRFPELPVIALGANRSHWYELLPALQTRANLYLEMSNIETGLALEQLVAIGVEDRLLHGSNHGASYANLCMERVRRSSVADQVKRKVLSANAAALFGES